jgi:hypothetical protein
VTRRRVSSIPAAGCKKRANTVPGQKNRCPQGFVAKAGLGTKTGTLGFLNQALCGP